MDILKLLFIVSLIAFVFGELIRIPILGAGVKLLDISVAITFIFWILHLVFKKKLSNAIYLPILIFSLLGGISLLLNLRNLNVNESIISFSYLLRWVGYAGILSLVGSFDEKFKNKIKIFLIFLGTFIVTCGYIQFIFYQNLKNLYYLGWDEHLYRMFSVFLDPNFAGAFFVLYFLFLLNLTFENLKSKTKLIFFSILSAVTLLSILLTYSRSAFLMLVVGICVFLVMKRKAIFIVTLVIIFVILTLFLPRAYKTEGTNFFRTVSSEARLDPALKAIEIFKKNPIFGVGFNAYRYAKSGYGHTISGWEESHADAGTDNSFLFVLATTGVIGFCAFIFLWYKILKLSKNSALILSSVIALFADSLFVNSLFYVFLIFWIWVLVGLRENK